MDLTKSHIHFGLFFKGNGIIVSVGLALLATATPLTAAQEEHSEGFLNQMKQWQEEMSETFRNAWQGIWADREAEETKDLSLRSAASIDLRELPDRYTIRLSLPTHKLDDVEVTLDGAELRLVAPSTDEGADPYEQIIVLRDAELDAKPEVHREDGLLVVTVPKSDSLSGWPNSPILTMPDLNEWERGMREHMTQMEREMDRISEQFWRGFTNFPSLESVPHLSQFGASIDLREQDDAFVLHVYLPDRNMEQINVTVEDQQVRIAANQEMAEREEGQDRVVEQIQKFAYSQVVTLPEPVRGKAMEIQRKEDLLIITIPKAKG